MIHSLANYIRTEGGMGAFFARTVIPCAPSGRGMGCGGGRIPGRLRSPFAITVGPVGAGMFCGGWVGDDGLGMMGWG
jgi:hypothetical protein